jgi:O-antigen/teichoic acid export membrane protein
MISHSRRLIKGTALNFIAVAFNQGSTLIANIIVARILMQQSFGRYSMVMSTLLTMAALSQLATGYTASKYIAELRTSDPDRAGRIMGACANVSVAMAGLGAILLVVMAPWLAGAMLNAPQLAPALVIGAGFLFFSSINGYQTGALSGLEAYASLARAGVASGLVAIATISLGARQGGLNGALVGLSLSAMFRCSIHYVFLRVETRRHGIEAKYRGSLKQEHAAIWQFALPAAISGYYSLPMLWLANTFLVRRSSGYEQMALYAAANNLRIVVLFLPNIINAVGLSILNNEMSKGNLANYKRVFRSNALQIFLISAGGALALGILGRSILGLFGGNFRDGYVLLWFLLASSIFEGTTIGLYQYIQSRAKLWSSLLCINVPREFLLVVVAYWLVQTQAGIGLAAAYLLSTILGLILTAAMVRKLLKVAE